MDKDTLGQPLLAKNQRQLSEFLQSFRISFLVATIKTNIFKKQLFSSEKLRIEI